MPGNAPSGAVHSPQSICRGEYSSATSPNCPLLTIISSGRTSCRTDFTRERVQTEFFGEQNREPAGPAFHGFDELFQLRERGSDLVQRGDPTSVALLELRRFQRCEYRVELIVRGNARREIEKLRQPIAIGPAHGAMATTLISGYVTSRRCGSVNSEECSEKLATHRPTS